MKASYKKYILNFKRPSGTSRGVLTEKETWFIILEENDKQGIGECGILRGLSIDDRPDYEEKLKWVCNNIHLGEEVLWNELTEFPSIQFGLEVAFRSLKSKSSYLLFPSAFTEGQESITINGLVWMGEKEFMKKQIEQKLQQGFNCIKLKIGAIDFDKELDLLAYIRSNFDAETIEIRVDANGAFSVDEALNKLQQISKYQIHSIEQPIKQGQVSEMAQLCITSPIPIALDEELIGIFGYKNKQALLEKIQPQYIILKPSLVGGYKGSDEWILLAEQNNIGWWATSALESNIGLNAIAQWTFTKNSTMPQGLGTGALYTNNFTAPLEVNKGKLHYSAGIEWVVDFN
ncbi:o-succinylbenzoate synthase [Flavobacterium suaedae]|uniref:O-succinylbenzoate synthase n=1 Tax=Flavobacterium suaedae TaxID=1767027 RepID=A0ABQ1JHE7_9FLAO|nr:o-succinylbenzoate synthase [Flavobacterium suaedae]GGB66388.1 o-succinylbenzoate synthase [Flavobacterium suaedae]